MNFSGGVNTSAAGTVIDQSLETIGFSGSSNTFDSPLCASDVDSNVGKFLVSDNS